MYSEKQISRLKYVIDEQDKKIKEMQVELDNKDVRKSQLENALTDAVKEIKYLLEELDNKDKQIEELKEQLESEKYYHKLDLEHLQKYHDENSDNKYRVLNLEHQSKQKDKQIDLMTDYIFEFLGNFTTKDSIKEYFEKGDKQL